MTKKRVRKIKYGNILLFFVALFLIIYLLINCINVNITSIYIKGNNFLSDQEIIEIAEISDYPSTFSNLSSTIEKKLETNIYIKDAKVYKNLFTNVYIEVIENKPLFYNKTDDNVVLLDGKTTEEMFNVPTLINYVPDTIYDEFLDKMGHLDNDILCKMSEIKYDPNNVDNERFLISMTDGNFVYLTLNKFCDINNYIDIIKNFNNEKGTLYLDSGEYFKKN